MARQIFSKDAQLFNIALTAEVKKIPEFVKPEWIAFVKTGISKQRVPESEDFWFTRTASILRQLYIHGVVGVERLRTRYGGLKDRGMRPDRFRKASGKIIRTILQQAERAGLLEKYNVSISYTDIGFFNHKYVYYLYVRYKIDCIENSDAEEV
jgi:ribosomal protein S19E (S16A)